MTIDTGIIAKRSTSVIVFGGSMLNGSVEHPVDFRGRNPAIPPLRDHDVGK